MTDLERPSSIQERGERIAADGIFTGQGAYRYEKTGRTQFEHLIRNGLNPWSRVLDIGCGALSGGYWMIHFLNPNRYFGIEPNREMLQAGLDQVLEADTAQQKRPRFDHNDRYDFSVFGERFDFFHACSIWTHAPKQDIEKTLDGLVEHGTRNARFITSFKPPTLFRPDYKGTEWVGASHESDTPGIVRHSLGWIRKACSSRGLEVTLLKGQRIHTQSVLRIDKPFD